MVYGNRDNNSGAGICTTRNPCTGQKLMTVEFIQYAAGEDVVQVVESATASSQEIPTSTTTTAKKTKAKKAKKEQVTEAEADVKSGPSLSSTSPNPSVESSVGSVGGAENAVSPQVKDVLTLGEFQSMMPDVYEKLAAIAETLEKTFKDMQVIITHQFSSIQNPAVFSISIH
jgi:phosphoenolpyruvate synthase/pyruvate phosphate dikinase